MADATCAHCGTPISDRSTMVRRSGETYCCNNCSMMAESQTPQHTNKRICSHCDMPILDTSGQVERDGQTFCCPNCAAAVAGGAGRSAGHPS